MDYRQERSIERYLCRRVKKIGGYAMKITSPGLAGVPDRLVLFNGLAVFVELKAPAGKLSDRQAAVHRILQGYGFPVSVVHNYDEVNRLVNEIERRGMKACQG